MAENPLAALRTQPTQASTNPLAALRTRAPALTPLPEGELSLGDVARGAWENLGPSAKQYAGDIWSAVSSPVDTGKALGKVLLGAGQKLVPGEQDYEQHADAVGRFFADRYGGWSNIKRTMAEDPVGFMADVSTVMTGGAGAAGRIPGVAGTATRVAGKVGLALDPIQIAGQAAKVAGRPFGVAGRELLGWTTGAKGESIRRAAVSGREGGEAGARFRGAMRGTTGVEEAVDRARNALAVLYQQRSRAYRQNMAAVRAETKPLSFDGIDKAIAQAESIKQFKGRDLSPKTKAIRDEIKEQIDAWRALDPGEYHTPAGMDALKQIVGDIQQSAKYGTPERRVADGVYNAIKREIARQAPEYNKAMGDYSRATEQLREIERSLGLGKKTSTDTALRKLQAMMRNDVSSAYGHRTTLGKMLEDAGAGGLLDEMAGQALSAKLPRGMATVATPLTIAGSTALTHPGALAMAPLASPRVMGEVVHAGGRAAGATERALGRTSVRPGALAAGSFQAGRTARVAGDPSTEVAGTEADERAAEWVNDNASWFGADEEDFGGDRETFQSLLAELVAANPARPVDALAGEARARNEARRDRPPSSYPDAVRAPAGTPHAGQWITRGQDGKWHLVLQ